MASPDHHYMLPDMALEVLHFVQNCYQFCMLLLSNLLWSLQALQNWLNQVSTSLNTTNLSPTTTSMTHWHMTLRNTTTIQNPSLLDSRSMATPTQRRAPMPTTLRSRPCVPKAPRPPTSSTTRCRATQPTIASNTLNLATTATHHLEPRPRRVHSRIAWIGLHLGGGMPRARNRAHSWLPKTTGMNKGPAAWYHKTSHTKGDTTSPSWTSTLRDTKNITIHKTITHHEPEICTSPEVTTHKPH